MRTLSQYGGSLFMICLGLGLALSLISELFSDTALDWLIWLRNLGITLIFSEIIGFSNLLLCSLLPDPNALSKKAWRHVYLTGEFTIGSLAGTGMAIYLTRWLFGIAIRPSSLTKYFLLIVLFSLLSAFGIYAFLMIKARLQGTVVALKEKQLQAERLEKLKAAAELAALQARIQPHFLFNTLNSIAALIREDPKLAEETTEKLSELFRYVLNSNRREFIRLGEEIEIVRNYLEIEKLRLGERLQYQIEVDEKLNALPVPALLIQPLVENCIKHGIGPLEAGGEIWISGKLNGEKCTLLVQDNGTGYAERQNTTGIGLQNIRERLENLYGNQAYFSILGQPGKGTRVEILLPVKFNAFQIA